MKKTISFLLTCMMILSTISIRIYADQEFQVSIAVLCKDSTKGQEFINKLCQKKSRRNVGYPLSCTFTNESNIEPNSTVIYDPVDEGKTIDTYHVKFHLLNTVDKSLLKKCSGAIILYDISDSTLNPIVSINTFSFEKLKDLTNVRTPLVQYINSSMFSVCFGFGRGWHGSLSFNTYGKEKLDLETYKFRCAQLNQFTCEAENYYKKTDNQWNRGHGDISENNCLGGTLYWICGQAYRSISSGFVSGKYYPSKKTHVDKVEITEDEATVEDKDIDAEKKTA